MTVNNWDKVGNAQWVLGSSIVNPGVPAQNGRVPFGVTQTAASKLPSNPGKPVIDNAQIEKDRQAFLNASGVITAGIAKYTGLNAANAATG